MNDPQPLRKSPILVYMPTYAPDVDAVVDPSVSRPYERLPQGKLAERVNEKGFLSRIRPWVYMDCVDSIINTRPEVDLVVADARSSESIREHLVKHQRTSIGYAGHPGYDLALFPQKESQWKALNTIIQLHATAETKYVVYTSSDIIWVNDWVGEAIKEFEADPALQIVFPCVSQGDPNLPCQIAQGPRDLPLVDPPYQEAARAHVLNGYAFIMRMDFLRTYGGYPTVYRNCFTESFLYDMCQAMGGKLRLMPRGYVYHHNGIDVWDATGKGDVYNYISEKPLFDQIMPQVETARVEGRCTVPFLKELLYAPAA